MSLSFQAPHNTVRYVLTRDPEDLECFLMNEVTGELALRQSLLYEPCRASFYFVSSLFYVETKNCETFTDKVKYGVSSSEKKHIWLKIHTG